MPNQSRVPIRRTKGPEKTLRRNSQCILTLRHRGRLYTNGVSERIARTITVPPDGGERARWKWLLRRQETILPHQLMLSRFLQFSTRGANSNRRQPFGYYPKALSVSCRCRINGEKNYKKRIRKEKRKRIRLEPFVSKLDHEKSYPTSHSSYVSAGVLKPTVRHQQTTKRHSRNPRRTMPRT